MYNSKSLNKKSIALLVLFFLSFIIIFLPAWKRLVLVWYQQAEYSHGFLIIPICLYIVWKKKPTLATISPRASRFGLPVIIFSLVAYLLSHFGEIFTVGYLSIISLIIGIILYLFGTRVLKEIAFPIFFLLFIIPVPSQIYSSLTLNLQLFVSAGTVWISKLLFNVPIERDGNIIYLKDITLQVVHACSGLRSMISLMAISALCGYLTLQSNILRFVLLVSAIPVSVAINIVRILLIIIVAHYFNYDLAESGAHGLLGLFVFFIGLVFILALRRVLSIWNETNP